MEPYEYPTEVQLESRIAKAPGRDHGVDTLTIYVTKRKDTFLSRARPEGAAVAVLYEGSPDAVPNELLDHLLVVGDSSYNSLRPFRWYKGLEGNFADTNDPESIVKTRKQSFGVFLQHIGSPERVWIYEIDESTEHAKVTEKIESSVS